MQFRQARNIVDCDFSLNCICRNLGCCEEVSTIILPTLSEETLNRLIQNLESDGVESFADYGLVTEWDLMDVLKR